MARQPWKREEGRYMVVHTNLGSSRRKWRKQWKGLAGDS